MSHVGKKPSFEQVRTDEIVVRQGASVSLTAGTTTLDLSGIGGKSFIRLTVSGSSSTETVISGITAPLSAEPARNGKSITLKNDSLIDIIFKEEAAAATAENRLLIGVSKEHTLSAGGTACFVYDNNASRWSLSGSSSEVTSSLVLDTNSVALTTSDLDLSTQPKKSSLIELTGASVELRSITAGKLGELMVLTNKTSSTLQVINEDTVPTANTRIVTGTGGPVSIPIDASILLSYTADSSSNSRWRIVGGTGSGGAATEQVAQTGIGVLATYPVGTPLYVDTTAWKKANAMAANTAEVAGLIGRRLNDNLAEVSLSGEVTGVTSSAFVEAALPTRGSVVFLSTTDGKLTVSDVTTIGYVSKPIGIVHNVNGATSVDIMFYNQRGAVVGSANARTQIALANNSTTPIQDIAAYDAGELAGWVWINATTDYRFYFQTQFAKNNLGTDYNIAVPQTVGDVPPAGFAMNVLMSGGSAIVRVVLPSLAGFVESYVNYAINAPAVGTSLPLSVNSTSVYTTYKTVSGATVLTAADDLVVATGASTYAITLPTAVGAVGKSYAIKCDLNSGVFLTISTTGGQLIDSSSSKILLKGESLSLVSDGSKWLNLNAPVLEGRGAVPLGAIIAIGNVSGWAGLPTSGQIKDGYALCDGQSFPTGSNALFSGTMPNLTDSRFLQGSSSVGGTGGSTSKTTTGIAASFDKNVMNSNQNVHTHGMQHTHRWGRASASGAQVSYYGYDISGGNAYIQERTSSNVLASGANYQLTYDTNGTSRNFYTQGSIVSGTGADRSDTDSQTISWNSTVVNTTVTQGTISDIRPNYFNVVYIMRVV